MPKDGWPRVAGTTNLNEEQVADDKLSTIALRRVVNRKAARSQSGKRGSAPFDYRKVWRNIMAEKNLHELFHETLKDIYFAEKKILSALPKMAKAAQSGELKAAFEKHETETEEHVVRLEKVFEEIGKTPRGKACDAIMGIIEEGQEVMKEFKGAPALDAGLLAAAQAVEHYEIARYGTLKTWAAELGLNQAVKLLEATLGEEKKTDETLTKLAQGGVNQHAQAA